MPAPESKVLSLRAICPKCGDHLYTYWHTPATDHPELGEYFVECNNENCDFKVEEGFKELTDVDAVYPVNFPHR